MNPFIIQQQIMQMQQQQQNNMRQNLNDDNKSQNLRHSPFGDLDLKGHTMNNKNFNKMNNNEMNMLNEGFFRQGK